MFEAAFILIVSTGLVFFYLQATCERILRREFDQKYFRAIVYANRLEYPSIRKAVQVLDGAVDSSRYRVALKCDFLMLSYLLRNAGKTRRGISWEERMLIGYFRFFLFAFSVRQWIGLREDPAVLKLTSILDYFANIVGKRLSGLRFGNLSATEYLMND